MTIKEIMNCSSAEFSIIEASIQTTLKDIFIRGQVENLDIPNLSILLLDNFWSRTQLKDNFLFLVDRCEKKLGHELENYLDLSS